MGNRLESSCIVRIALGQSYYVIIRGLSTRITGSVSLEKDEAIIVSFGTQDSEKGLVPSSFGFTWILTRWDAWR